MPRLPQLTARELVRFLKAQGFVEDRQAGSHLTLWHEGRRVAVTIPMHTGTDVGRGLAVRILKDPASPSTTTSDCDERGNPRRALTVRVGTRPGPAGLAWVWLGELSSDADGTGLADARCPELGTRRRGVPRYNGAPMATPAPPPITLTLA